MGWERPGCRKTFIIRGRRKKNWTYISTVACNAEQETEQQHSSLFNSFQLSLQTDQPITNNFSLYTTTNNKDKMYTKFIAAALCFSAALVAAREINQDDVPDKCLQTRECQAVVSTATNCGSADTVGMYTPPPLQPPSSFLVLFLFPFF